MFVAVVAAGVRAELSRAFIVVGVGILALAVSVLVYDGSALGLLAYSLGFAAATLAGANARQAAARAEQAELLLAQTQRSHEEQLRAARLEESTRIAREIHDVLAHALAGLTIQLEATSSLVDQGADRATIKARLDRAHALAREGLRETRRAVGALRGEPVAARAGIEALVEEYRAADGDAELTIDGDPGRLAGPVGEAVLRVVQEALTNVRKHAPGASVSVALHAGDLPDHDVVARRRRPPERHRASSEPAGRDRRRLRYPRHARTCPGSRRHPHGRHPSAMAGGSNCAFRLSLGLPARRPSHRGWGGLRPVGAVVSDPIRVLVADDQALVREGLMTLLEVAAGIEPVAAAADGEQAVVLAARHRPHVVLMDLRMPRLDGVEATRRIRAAQPETEIVVLTTHADDQSILGALQAGARGYLTKDAGIAEISRAIQAAAAHQALLDPAVQARLLAAATASAAPVAPAAELPDELTPREAEVLSLIARGMSNTEIATALVVSEATVKSHINHLFAKIGARDRAQAVHYAYTHGLAV